MEKFKRPKQTKEEKADSDLRQLLNYSDVSDTETIRGKSTWRRTREGIFHDSFLYLFGS